MLALKQEFLGRGPLGLPLGLTGQPVRSGSGAGNRPDPRRLLPRPRQRTGGLKAQFFRQGRLPVPSWSRSVGDQQPFHQKDSRSPATSRTREGLLTKRELKRHPGSKRSRFNFFLCRNGFKWLFLQTAEIPSHPIFCGERLSSFPA